MATAVEQLTQLLESAIRYDIPLAELLPVQLAAANERLAQHRQAIKLVANRAETGGIAEIRKPADLVPLLFAHTAYKSYPETWLAEGKWDRLCAWLSTVTATPVQGIDNRGVSGIDDWIALLAEHGHYICCSSGTTGKISMIPASAADRALTRRICVATFEWVTGIAPEHDRKVFVCHPGTNNFRFLDSWDALSAAYGTGEPAYRFPGAPVTVGRIRAMVALRKRIAEGTARPGEIAEFEQTAAARQQEMHAAVGSIATAMLEHRHEKLLIAGMPALLFEVADTIAARGPGAAAFHPQNTLMASGGLKGAQVPADYHERTLAAFNVQPRHVFNMYGMQELNTYMPRCAAGRHHVAPWLMLLPLDAAGETLLEPQDGIAEGRAAYFDLSHEGRWGGVISGDKITVHYGRCPCGHEGPAIGGNIQRYSDLPGGDKISCSGSIDAYVRGAVS